MYSIPLSCLGWCPSCYLELLDKLQKLICRTVVLQLLLLLNPLTNCWNVARLILFYRYYSVRCSSEMPQMIPFHCSQVRFTPYSDRLPDFSDTIPSCYKDVYVNNSFPCIDRLRNSLLIQWFLLTYNLNGFMSRISRHLLAVKFFLKRFHVCFNMFALLFL